MDKKQGRKQIKLLVLEKVLLFVLSIACIVLSFVKPIGVNEGFKSVVDPTLFVIVPFSSLMIKNSIRTLKKKEITSEFIMLVATIVTFVIGVLVAFGVIISVKNYFAISAILSLSSYLVILVNTFLVKALGCVKVDDFESALKTPKFIARFIGVGSFVVLVLTFAVVFIIDLDVLVALERAISVLLIFTPSSYFISAIIALSAMQKNARKNGIIYNNKDYLKRLSNVKNVIFDDEVLFKGYDLAKTIAFQCDEKEVLSLAKTIAQLDDKFGKFFEKVDCETGECNECKSFDGGVRGVIEKDVVELVTPAYLSKNYNYDVSAIVRTEYNVLFLVINGVLSGAILFTHVFCENVKELIDECKSLNIKTVLFSKNTLSNASFIQKELGVKEVYADLLEEDKEYVITKIKIRNDGDVFVVTKMGQYESADFTACYTKEQTDDTNRADVQIISQDVKKISFLIRLLQNVFSKIKFNIILGLVITFLSVAVSEIGFVDLFVAIGLHVLLDVILSLNAVLLIKVK